MRAHHWLVAVAALGWMAATPVTSHAATVRPAAVSITTVSPAAPTDTASPQAGVSPTPTPTNITTQPDHGPWVMALVIGGFVGAGVLTLLLARHNARRAGPQA